MKRLVKNVMEKWNIHEFLKLKPESSIIEALRKMEEQQSSVALVIERTKLRGIVSKSDFARASLYGIAHRNDQISHIMTKKVFFATPDFTLEQCLYIMTKSKIRYLPVIEGSEPVALISMSRIMEALIEDREHMIKNLTTYITGSSVDTSMEYEQAKWLTVPVRDLEKEPRVV